MPKLSPHVTIYRFPTAAISSITNRLSGLYLSGVFVGVGISFLTPYEIRFPRYIEAGTVGAIVYHTLGGIRHFVWDFKPNLMTNSIAHFSSIGLAVSSIGITTAYMHLKTSKPRIN